MRPTQLLSCWTLTLLALAAPAHAFRIMGDPDTFDGDPDGEYNDIAVTSTGLIIANANPDGANLDGLWAVPTPSGPDDTVTATRLTSFFDPDVNSVPEISPDEQTIYYAARVGEAPNNFNQVFSIPIGGGASTQLTFPSADFVNSVTNPRVTPDGTTLVVNALDSGGPDLDNLFALPVGGGSPVRLMSALEGDASEGQWDIAPDGSSVFIAPGDGAGGPRTSILSLAIDGSGSTPIPISGAPAFFDIDEGLIAGPDGFLYFVGDYFIEDVNEALRIPVAGGTPERVSDTLVATADVRSIALSPDASVLAYVADNVTDGVGELFATPIGGGLGQSLKISDPVLTDPAAGDTPDVPGDDDGAVVFSADGTKVYYRADFNTNNVADIYVVEVPEFNAPLLGDANGDGTVDLLDLDILGGNFGITEGATVAEGDFNGDGAVDLLDLDILGQNFGVSNNSAAVPEPSSLLLAIVAAVTLGRLLKTA